MIYFFLGVGFSELSTISKVIISAISLAAFSLAYLRGLYVFFLTFLTGFGMFLALGISFSNSYTGDSPIALNIVLGPWTIFFISLLCMGVIFYIYEKVKYRDKFPLLLLVLYIVLWIILSINVKYFDDWKLENYLTVPFIILIFLLHRWFRLSNLSYGLIFAFMTLHVIGTHYTYSDVPFGYWMQNFLGLDRNHYDRIVHFTFGLLFAYPMREIVIRIGNVKGFWALYVPIEFVLAFSAIYEIIEWIIAIMFGGDLGIAYLGTQGDVWDAIKDMALAGTGSVITMFVTFLVIIYYNHRDFLKEFKDSLKVKEKEVLGERAIEKFVERKRN